MTVKQLKNNQDDYDMMSLYIVHTIDGYARVSYGKDIPFIAQEIAKVTPYSKAEWIKLTKIL